MHSFSSASVVMGRNSRITASALLRYHDRFAICMIRKQLAVPVCQVKNPRARVTCWLRVEKVLTCRERV